MTYPKADDDGARVEYLRSLAILDTAPDENLDRIVRLCRSIFGLPISTISLVDEDRQWFKAFEGLDACETDREAAFCNYTILGVDVFEVCDTHLDPVFRENALVTGPPHLRYYAGSPIALDGVRIGALCLMDVAPREPLSATQRAILVDLAAVVVREIEVNRLMRETIALLA